MRLQTVVVQVQEFPGSFEISECNPLDFLTIQRGFGPRNLQSVSADPIFPEDSTNFSVQALEGFAICECFPQSRLRCKRFLQCKSWIPRESRYPCVKCSVFGQILAAMLSAQLLQTAKGTNLDGHTMQTQQQLPNGSGNSRIINFRKIFSVIRQLRITA